MKKKILPVIALFLSLTLTACGGGNDKSESKPTEGSETTSQKSTTSGKTSTSKHTHTFDETRWESNETQHWHPATCEHTTQKGSAADHTFVADTTKTNKPASCEEEGVNYVVCSVCGYKAEQKVPALGHVFEADGEAKGANKVQPEKDNGCSTKAYRFDVGEATGWNKPGTKMNGKTSPDNQSAWAINGIVPAGKYKVFINTRMSYQSHEDRYFYNQYETDTASQPDKESEDPFRYYFAVDEGEACNPLTKKSWGELGMKGGDNAEFTTVDVEATVTIAADSQNFYLRHGNIGYSLVIAYVRLVEIKTAA